MLSHATEKPGLCKERYEACQSLQVGDTTLELDEHGFLQQPELWNDAVARALAANEGVHELTADHWKVVRLPAPTLARLRSGADGSQALQADRRHAEADLRAVPSGPGEGRVQGRGHAQRERLCLTRHRGNTASGMEARWPSSRL